MSQGQATHLPLNRLIASIYPAIGSALTGVIRRKVLLPLLKRDPNHLNSEVTFGLTSV